ncbi:alkaline phosphatase D [Streptoalloteichus tenebrarius]|uniref:Alkaline phosphatase D n=1 Tax=Streptoalloteichus tenebrarius (strain ATCC 17920 / DSM 40477 / JCM 4838 / CBS 697.72 / NBRC 16177 / NCIMB 11028 / NRRL B-12390 / A12253. 1 / ISP 5477) TaxID=1933 RepID=A0ABT1HSA3_STRSD|nr:alkaline phosphatase D family protein [Streptoalloteichus tenebrarius]MCP2258408.1 alkaline phosphatase D [Streptoalloteichus tenebrarius]BFF03578.1 alkaline phosphatase D family protein [Streptoalloteichus tenebrarius]
MSTPWDRRTLLRATGAAALGVAAAGTLPSGAHAATAAASTFQHGVASGDPLPDGVLLWTRVSPTEDAVPGSGVGPEVEVRWEVATDASFGAVVASGVVRTGPDHDHTVKVDVGGLAPATRYAYRFHHGGQTSPVGFTRTAPAADAPVARLRFGVVSCANWQAGHFGAYRFLAERADLDAVLHMGDYLYEYGPGGFPLGYSVRPHDPPHEAVTLADYRRRHAQYKTDPHLQRLHATHPFIVTWDDHEVANDAWSGGAQNHSPDTEGDYATRKAAAHRAYFEWMPVRNVGDRIYRRLRFGRLAELSLLDLRSYRSQQAKPFDGAVDDPKRTMTGAEQMRWLVDGLVGSTAQWKLVGTSVMVSPVLLPPLPAELTAPVAELLGLPREGGAVLTDQWDGYAADRRTLLRALADHHVRDTVFLTGDIHSSWASDVPLDAGTYPLSPSVATELVCTSVTSDNIDDFLKAPPRTASVPLEAGIMALNRHIRWVELDSHGASVLEVTPVAAQMDWYYLADRKKADSGVTHARSYRVRAGTQRVQRSWIPLD